MFLASCGKLRIIKSLSMPNDRFVIILDNSNDDIWESPVLWMDQFYIIGEELNILAKQYGCTLDFLRLWVDDYEKAADLIEILESRRVMGQLTE